MTQVSISTIAAGADVDAAPVQGNFVALRDAVNGNLDSDNLTTATRQRLGLSDASTVRSGKSIIATQEDIAGATLTALTTPDRVSGLVVPVGGLLLVSVWARVTKTVGITGETVQVGLFLNGTQVKSRMGAAVGGSTGVYGHPSISNGTAATSSSAVYTSDDDNGFGYRESGAGNAVDDAVAGHPIGPFIPIPVNAGTYTVELRWSKLAPVTANVQDRRLYVYTQGF